MGPSAPRSVAEKHGLDPLGVEDATDEVPAGRLGPHDEPEGGARAGRPDDGEEHQLIAGDGGLEGVALLVLGDGGDLLGRQLPQRALDEARVVAEGRALAAPTMASEED